MALSCTCRLNEPLKQKKNLYTCLIQKMQHIHDDSLADSDAICQSTRQHSLHWEGPVCWQIQEGLRPLTRLLEAVSKTKSRL